MKKNISSIFYYLVLGLAQSTYVFASLSWAYLEYDLNRIIFLNILHLYSSDMVARYMVKKEIIVWGLSGNFKHENHGDHLSRLLLMLAGVAGISFCYYEVGLAI